MGSKSHQKISKWLIIWLMFSFGLIVNCTTISTTISSTTLRAILDKVKESVNDHGENNGHDGDSNLEYSISNVDNINNNNNYSDNKSIDLENAETKDPQKLEIIKQIRKLNHDGSYTVGYEAEDGTFKIESRDVLGNIKGTYGYIDENGDIKRISYTANNTTNGLRTTTLHSSGGGSASTKSSLPNVIPTETPTIRTTSTSTPIEEIVYIPPRPNRTMYSSTTRRPSSLAYLTSPQPPVVSSTKSNVIQSIPKRRMLYSSLTSTTPKTTTTSKTTSTTTTTTTPSPLKAEPTTTLVYATSVPSSIKPFIRTTPLPSFHYKTAEHQISRPPDRLEIAELTSKVLHVNSNSNNNQNIRENAIMSSSTTKPVTEIVDESSDQIDDDADDKKPLHGNNLRRQLIDQQQRDNNDNDGDNNDDVDRRRFESQQQFLYSQSNIDDDTSSHIYGPSASVTNRPLFTTTHSSRIPSLVLAARTRAAQIQNILNSQTTEKPYIKPPQRTRPLIYLRRQNDIKETNDNSVDDEDDNNDGVDRENVDQPTTESTSENTYLTQSPIPSANRLDSVNAQSNGVDEQRRLMYRRPIYLRQRSREFLRQAPPPGLDFNNGPQQYRIPIPQAAVYPPEHLTQVGRPLGNELQYLKETTSVSPSSPSPLKSHGGVTAAAAEVYPLSENSESGTRTSSLHPRSGYLPNQHQQQYGENQLYPIPYINQNPYGPYSANRHALPLAPVAPQQYYNNNNNNPDRPLTARDFERILNLLVIRQQQLQRFNGFYPQINPYASSPIMNPLYNPYVGYAGTPPFAGYQQQIPRPPINPFYDPRYYEPFGRENAYQAQQPIPSQQPYTGQRIIQRRKQPQYNPQYMSGATQNYLTEYPNDQQQSTNQYMDGHTSSSPSSPSSQTFNQNPDYLPPDIREELLYRMLMLAIQSNNEHNDVSNQEYIAAGSITKGNTSPIPSTSISPLSSSSSSSLSSQSTTSSPLNYRKPIRSVQILGEDE